MNASLLSSPGALNVGQRRRSLRRLAADRFDVVVVGGGITGVGAALDAATRGLSTGLVEAEDFAAGTSSKSSKLLHGGLRYLEMLDFGLVREALRERDLMLNRIAPHLVRPVRFMFPFTHRAWERWYVGAGLALYGTMGGAQAVPRARHLSRRGALRRAPALDPTGLSGAALFYDAQEDDARMVAYVARTAAANGAVIATRVRATGFVVERGRVTHVEAIDLESGETLTIRARHVVAAAGVHSNEICAMAGTTVSRWVRPSKGVHLLVPRSRIAMRDGLFARTEKSVLFVIPWAEHWLIGDTDTDWAHDVSRPTASGADIDYLLAKTNGVLRTPLTRADVVGVFAGLRPLVGGADVPTSKLSREHTVAAPLPGLSTIAGGKYTTYRVMARDLIDAAAADLPGDVAASCTERVPLVGADGYPSRWNGRATIARETKLTLAQVERLLGRYGSCIDEVLASIEADPALGLPVEGATAYLRAEVVYACTHEGAMHVEDVLDRRTRISFETRHRGVGSARCVAELMAGVLSWDERRVRGETARFGTRVEAELAAQEQPDDAAALAARRRIEVDGKQTEKENPWPNSSSC
jgi:glycerol-3-phosphate dehydrogenase